MNDTVSNNDPYEGREEVRPYPVTLTITPTGVMARELPLVLVSDVADVLQAHGLRVGERPSPTPRCGLCC